MKNSQVLEINEKLKQNINDLKSLKGFKFNYMLLKNIKLIETELDIFKDMITPSDEYKEYEEARVQLCNTLCKKDEEGNNLLKNNETEFDIDLTSKEWIEGFNDLTTKYENVIKERSEQIEAYNLFLTEESTIEFFKIDEENVPEEINLELLIIIFEFIN